MKRAKIVVRVAARPVKQGEREVVDAMKEVTPFSIPDDPEVAVLKGRVNMLAQDVAELRAIVKEYLQKQAKHETLDGR